MTSSDDRTPDALPHPAATPDPSRTPLRIGILATAGHDGVSERGGTVRSQGIEDALTLIDLADELGLDAAYVRTRHLQEWLSAPLPFLAAAAQRALRIDLGTQVIPLRFENAARLAEDLATTDLLTGGRLRIGVAPGYSSHDGVYARAFGSLAEDQRTHVDRLLTDLLNFLDGEVVAMADEHIEGVEPGTPLRIRPQSPTLRSRLAYGAASIERAEDAARRGLGLQLATLHPDDGSGRSLEEMQVEVIAAYREARRAHDDSDGFVSVGRQVIPVADEATLELFPSLPPRERAASLGGTAAAHTGTEIGGRAAVFGTVHLEVAETVAEALLQDPAVLAADELVVHLPAGIPQDAQRGIVRVLAERVAPILREATGSR
ncbi:LLM class flavin-dependent oxidoreductase [Brachybacterium sp. EF45031]|uniref:LLM class flavin-dependent oxidoreductase n=1 Tax=Brachybacterium sillae TaxID=2810536 RepID=UPI00217EF1FA|nr:LLM class flavin-dependent oxidoreductase [Brachybacterium sillae]MCS6710751.1 LLM class flavin-dependent oxidoreductase [Brachybacterium sillae]